MVNKVEWSKKSLQQIRDIIGYLRTEASEQAADNFVELFRKKLELVKIHPTRGRKSTKSRTIHFVNFGKHHQLFYRMNGLTLHIVEIWDTRQDPKKRKY
jgi:plasmid stabilization system protein ParE